MFYTYTVDANPVIVTPTSVQVIASVPNRPGVAPTQAKLTLTTCNPRWASTSRMIVYGTLASATPKSAGEPPALTKGA